MSGRRSNNGATRSPYMTRNRRRVLEELIEARENGEPVTYARIARRCGLYSYRNARRTVRDLKRLGMV